ncbi:transcriptional repressor [Methanosalsum natronophilum]|uniref:Transcriptional repressor n=1 Tax=Methanosalsum natronophilum TaxID=768733 RepID=A0A424Z435_9EURY|nr:MAG: transcriptional repressor [Methanosalsum natronophilum]
MDGLNTSAKTIKYTNQRMEILKFLREFNGHPTVDDVYEGVKCKLSRISKATVYNNLRFLAEKGLIKEVNTKGVSRFESNLVTHHHIICLECGDIKDYESEELTEYSLNVAAKIDGFKIESTDTNFYGYCNKCRRKQNG